MVVLRKQICVQGLELSGRRRVRREKEEVWRGGKEEDEKGGRREEEEGRGS
jgi:hypothetical protein